DLRFASRHLGDQGSRREVDDACLRRFRDRGVLLAEPRRGSARRDLRGHAERDDRRRGLPVLRTRRCRHRGHRTCSGAQYGVRDDAGRIDADPAVREERAAENAHAEEDAEGVEAAKESDGVEGYARKLREAKLAVAVEKKYDKKEILNRYMNINNYSGSPNVYGVEAAAYRYWGIHAKDLNIQQSAMLAGIVQNPSAFNPQRFPDQ